MNFDKLEVVQLGHMLLSQKKFQDGALLVSGIKDDKEFIAIDVRFYLMKDNGWLPTKTGFWVARDNWKTLKKTLSNPMELIGEAVCWENKNRKFIIRYIPAYGGGIDFRYYCETKKYTGWEKKGIRIAQKDYNQVKKIIQAAIKSPEELIGDSKITIKGHKKTKQYHMKIESSVVDSKSVNPALMEILGK